MQSSFPLILMTTSVAFTQGDSEVNSQYAVHSTQGAGSVYRPSVLWGPGLWNRTQISLFFISTLRMNIQSLELDSKTKTHIWSHSLFDRANLDITVITAIKAACLHLHDYFGWTGSFAQLFQTSLHCSLWPCLVYNSLSCSNLNNSPQGHTDAHTHTRTHAHTHTHAHTGL